MKRSKLLGMVAFMLAITASVFSKANDKPFLKNGFRKDATACTLVHNVPNNCAVAPGISCGFFNAQGSPSSTCIDPLNHP